VPDRVDLQGNYTRFPANPSPGFPNQREIWLPVVELLVVHGQRRCRVMALLDSGAGMCLFGTAYADALGIDWQKCPTQTIHGVGGSAVGHVADVKFVLPAANYAWPAKAVFSGAIGQMINPLVGHLGFFEHFEVRFRGGSHSFRIHLK
jgi:aspartyl protease